MSMIAVTLDPYTKQVSIITSGEVLRCSYQEAISTPRIASILANETVMTIVASLEAAQ